jgi:hypothetical protein
MPQPTQDKRGILLANISSPIYDWANPDGDRNTLLFRETFESGALSSKSGWLEYPSSNLNYAAIVTSGSGKALRHNLHNSRGSNDPISDRPCSGLYTHCFRADLYHTAETHPEITFDHTYRFDDCLWDTNVNDAYPLIAGKLFITDKTVDSLALYLGLTNNTTLTLVCGNDASGVWSNDPAIGWVKESYGWRNVNATARNNILFATPNPVFRSDGVSRTLRLEIRYNPGSIGYHKARIKIGGITLHDSLGINTDEDGWFNLPPEFELKGVRVYAADLDINDAQDSISNPETYEGIAAGYEVDEYALYSGVGN